MQCKRWHCGSHRAGSARTQVCDQPHPEAVKNCLAACARADFEAANAVIEDLWEDGYCGLDIVGTLFRLCKFSEIPEETKLEFLFDDFGGDVATLFDVCAPGGKGRSAV